MSDEANVVDGDETGAVTSEDTSVAGGESSAETGSGGEGGDNVCAQKISIALDVPLVPQPTDKSCWAASLTMVISVRDQASYAVEDVAAKANMDTNTGYGWDDIRKAVEAWNLVEEGPVSAMPDYWADLLRDKGPIWIVEVGAPYHAVVIVGMEGDGTPENTKVKVNNPWPPNQGAVENKTFLDFDKEYGLGAGADAMIVHG